MSIVELFKPTKADDDPRFKLAISQMVADEDEVDNFGLHVRNDIRRFSATIELHKASFDSSQQNKTWLIMIAGFLAFTQFPQLAAFIEKFL